MEILKEIPYKFKDLTLLDDRYLVGRQWFQSTLPKYPVYDPADQKEIWRVANVTRQEARNAVETAEKAFRVYKRMAHRQRAILLRKWAALIRENADDLAAIVTLELGKPFAEAKASIIYSTDFLDMFASSAEQLMGETVPAARQTTRIWTVREPQGVVVAITPWNAPVTMITRKCGAAIAAGNTVVCKPAPETPMCTIAYAKLFERVGFPPGVFNVVTCSPEQTPEIGEEFCSNPIVRHVSFTGSTAVGKWLNSRCALQIKKMSLELGGNAPFIIFEDANLDQAVDGLIASKIRSSGQVCISANRVFVHESIMEEFKTRLVKRIPEFVKSGSLWDNSGAINFGPIYSPKGVEKIERHIADAVSLGAKVILGGSVDHSFGPNHFQPTVLAGCSTKMQFCQEETFGPVIALMPFSSEEQVLDLANDSRMGLAGYFYTEDIGRIYRVTEALEVGMVGCRLGVISACEQPFGGVKESGLGREGSHHALDEYVNVKAVTLGL